MQNFHTFGHCSRFWLGGLCPCVGPAALVGMDIVARLKATKAFLAGVRGTKGFDQVLEMQAANVESMLDNSNVSLDAAAEIVGLLKECGWSDETVAKLLGKVGTACSKAGVEDHSHNFQDYRMLKQYFTQEEWSMLLGSSPPEDKQDVILVRMRELGGQRISESSVSEIAALVLAVSMTIDKAINHGAAEKFEFFKHVKEQVKLHKALHLGPWVLPRKPQAYPDNAVFERIYGQSVPVNCPLDMSKLTALAAGIPCRSSSKLLRASPLSSSAGTASRKGQNQMADFAQMMQQMMTQMMGSPQSSGCLRIMGGGGSRSRKASLSFTPDTGGIPALDNQPANTEEDEEGEDKEKGADAEEPPLKAPKLELLGAAATGKGPQLDVVGAAQQLLGAMAANKADAKAKADAAKAEAKAAAKAKAKAAPGGGDDSAAGKAEAAGEAGAEAGVYLPEVQAGGGRVGLLRQGGQEAQDDLLRRRRWIRMQITPGSLQSGWADGPGGAPGIGM